MSVTLVHPAKANGRNEMPSGRDAHVVPSNTAIRLGLQSPHGEIWGSDPPVCSDAAYCQITLALVIFKCPTFLELLQVSISCQGRMFRDCCNNLQAGAPPVTQPSASEH